MVFEKVERSIGSKDHSLNFLQKTVADIKIQLNSSEIEDGDDIVDTTVRKVDDAKLDIIRQRTIYIKNIN